MARSFEVEKIFANGDELNEMGGLNASEETNDVCDSKLLIKSAALEFNSTCTPMSHWKNVQILDFIIFALKINLMIIAVLHA